MQTDAPSTDHDAFREQMARIIAGDAFDDLASPARAGVPQTQKGQVAIERRVPIDRAPSPPGRAQVPAGCDESPFLPLEPETLADCRISEAQIEGLILKFLCTRPTASGRDVSDFVALPFRLTGQMLRQMKEDLLVVYKGAAPMSDYVYELTELGLAKARRFNEQCTYLGPTPVSLEDYVTSVAAQSIRKCRPKIAALRQAFSDLLLGDEILRQIGQAVWSGLGLFLYGSPGNGKTSIAQRLTRAFGESIWIPHAFSVMGEVIQIYDPTVHEVSSDDFPAPMPGGRELDQRWVRICRPTIVGGGELRMENLEITTNGLAGRNEAPLQLKANGGTLVIDDFGRQRITPSELLNRWIVPLEQRYDFLNLPSGHKIQVPFDQLIVFSTNLEPRDLIDEALLRRIPYKIDVKDPTETEFRELFRRVADAMGMNCDRGAVNYLIEKHYRKTGRAMRFCHPRDLLHQASVYCNFHEQRLALTNEAIDAAVKNYFVVMQG